MKSLVIGNEILKCCLETINRKSITGLKIFVINFMYLENIFTLKLTNIADMLLMEKNLIFFVVVIRQWYILHTPADFINNIQIFIFFKVLKFTIYLTNNSFFVGSHIILLIILVFNNNNNKNLYCLLNLPKVLQNSAVAFNTIFPLSNCSLGSSFISDLIISDIKFSFCFILLALCNAFSKISSLSSSSLISVGISTAKKYTQLLFQNSEKEI